jgi:hypothetical protein
LHGWQVSQFAEAVLLGNPIKAELFRSVALSAKAVLLGADPEKAFKINEGKPETRGLSPLGKQLHELDIAIEVAREIEINKTFKNRNRKYGSLKTLIYNGVAKKHSISARTVQGLSLLSG